MSENLPGWSVKILGASLDPYSLREDEEYAYLVYGSEEVIEKFNKRVTFATIEGAIRADQHERASKRVVIP
jgi:hypothetical protein